MLLLVHEQYLQSRSAESSVSYSLTVPPAGPWEGCAMLGDFTFLVFPSIIKGEPLLVWPSTISYMMRKFLKPLNYQH